MHHCFAFIAELSPVYCCLVTVYIQSLKIIKSRSAVICTRIKSWPPIHQQIKSSPQIQEYLIHQHKPLLKPPLQSTKPRNRCLFPRYFWSVYSIIWQDQFQGMSTAVTGDLGPVAPKALEKDDEGVLREADRWWSCFRTVKILRKGSSGRQIKHRWMSPFLFDVQNPRNLFEIILWLVDIPHNAMMVAGYLQKLGRRIQQLYNCLATRFLITGF